MDTLKHTRASPLASCLSSSLVFGKWLHGDLVTRRRGVMGRHLTSHCTAPRWHAQDFWHTMRLENMLQIAFLRGPRRSSIFASWFSRKWWLLPHTLWIIKFYYVMNSKRYEWFSISRMCTPHALWTDGWTHPKQACTTLVACRFP